MQKKPCGQEAMKNLTLIQKQEIPTISHRGAPISRRLRPRGKIRLPDFPDLLQTHTNLVVDKTLDHPTEKDKHLKRPIWIRWLTLVLLLMSTQREWLPEGPIPFRKTFSTRSTALTTPQTKPGMADPFSPAYKAALSDRLDEHRSERYKHLTHSRYTRPCVH